MLQRTSPFAIMYWRKEAIRHPSHIGLVLVKLLFLEHLLVMQRERRQGEVVVSLEIVLVRLLKIAAALYVRRILQLVCPVLLLLVAVLCVLLIILLLLLMCILHLS